MYLKLEEETASNITNNDTKYHEYTYRQSVSWGKKKKKLHICVHEILKTDLLVCL